MRLNAGIWRQTIDTLHACGEDRRECVVYWLGAPGSGVVDTMIHPKHRAGAGHYELDPEWLNHFWDDLVAMKKSVLVQVHTHGGVAFHSGTDDRFPLIHTAGFFSLVVPDFANGVAGPASLFLAELRADGEFHEADVAEFIEGIYESS